MYMDVNVVTSSGETVVEKRMSKEYSSWRKVDKLLTGWIYSSIHESVIGQVVGCKSSYDVWN